jgi:hypothetical protein
MHELILSGMSLWWFLSKLQRKFPQVKSGKHHMAQGKLQKQSLIVKLLMKLNTQEQ